MKIKFEVQTSVNRIKCTMLPLIFMRLSNVKENKKICFFQLPQRLEFKFSGSGHCGG